jgi:uncharacterized protein (DUF2235 family)
MAKNIILCLDGTGNQLKARDNTNVVRLFSFLKLDDPDQQIGYYDPGVGTFGAKGALLPLSHGFTRLMGLAFGYGVRENLADAYTFLLRTFEPGDKIFIFGFSRGAFTGRALAGMLNRAGLLRRGAENLVPYAVRVYARSDARWTKKDWAETGKFAKYLSIDVEGKHRVPIFFLGLWDSVKAAGLLRGEMTWPDTDQLPNAQYIRHAVSIDEKRRPYRECLVRPKLGDPFPDSKEVWFAGVHSDVGGGFEKNRGLGDISLKWMTEQARDQGLLLNGAEREALKGFSSASARDTIHRMSWAWALLTYRRRPVFPPDARVHKSVLTRMDSGDYHPKLAQPRWEDPEWSRPL